MDNTEQQKEEPQELDAAAQATTAQESEVEKPEVKEPEKVEDPLAELKARLEKAEKIAKDNQAWATRLAQERAQEKREREQREREASKPAILDANPELAEAIRYVAGDPAPQRKTEDRQAEWARTIEQVHPGIFTLPDEDELVKALVARRSDAWEDPLVAIREITEEKLALTERQVGKRFAAEAAKLAQKSAMSVPSAGAGAGVMTPVDAQLAEVQRIQKMSDADFQKEVRRVKGLL